jgi:protoporphyrin/coproporphyrin ferrochelatase
MNSKSNGKIGVVLFNLGGPDSQDAVEPFLYNLFNDPEIINFPGSFIFRKGIAKLISSLRYKRIQEQYKEIGGKSPLLEFSRKQAALLTEELERRGVDAHVTLAMRYWHPFTEEAIADLESVKPDRLVLLPLYPQFSKSTTGSSFKEWDRRIKGSQYLQSLPEVRVGSYETFGPYIEAVAKRIDETLARFPEEERDSVVVLFSAHGTPMKLVREGDPYSHQIEKTVDAVVAREGFKNEYRLCYQSKVGPQKWLTPSTPDVIEELAKAGVKNMLVVPIAFVSDHLETLFEIGLEFSEEAHELGVERFEVMEGLNESPYFISALADLVCDRVRESS